MIHRAATIFRGRAWRQPRQVRSYGHVETSSQSLSVLINGPL